jgi:hypothetical protein
MVRKNAATIIGHEIRGQHGAGAQGTQPRGERLAGVDPHQAPKPKVKPTVNSRTPEEADHRQDSTEVASRQEDAHQDGVGHDHHADAVEQDGTPAHPVHQDKDTKTATRAAA